MINATPGTQIRITGRIDFVPSLATMYGLRPYATVLNFRCVVRGYGWMPSNQGISG